MSDQIRINKKEYQRFLKYQSDVRNGKVLTPEGLRFICEAYNFCPTEIGKHLISVLAKIENT